MVGTPRVRSHRMISLPRCLSPNRNAQVCSYPSTKRLHWGRLRGLEVEVAQQSSRSRTMFWVSPLQDPSLLHTQAHVAPWSQGSPHLCSSHCTPQLQREGRVTTPWTGWVVVNSGSGVTIRASLHSLFSFGLALPTSQSELNTEGPRSSYWKGRRHGIHLSHQGNHLTAKVPALEVQPGEGQPQVNPSRESNQMPQTLHLLINTVPRDGA